MNFLPEKAPRIHRYDRMRVSADMCKVIPGKAALKSWRGG
jgi:hypothetical protein